MKHLIRCSSVKTGMIMGRLKVSASLSLFLSTSFSHAHYLLFYIYFPLNSFQLSCSYISSILLSTCLTIFIPISSSFSLFYITNSTLFAPLVVLHLASNLHCPQALVRNSSSLISTGSPNTQRRPCSSYPVSNKQIFRQLSQAP